MQDPEDALAGSGKKLILEPGNFQDYRISSPEGIGFIVEKFCVKTRFVEKIVLTYSPPAPATPDPLGIGTPLGMHEVSMIQLYSMYSLVK